MNKRITCVLIALAFVCSSFLFLSACAKKQVGTETAAPPSAKVEKAPETKVEPPKAKVDDASAALAAQIKEFESGNIYFDFDKSDIKAEAEAVLKKKAAFLKANSAFSVQISGHCDERGTKEYNMALGERRAFAAKKYLMNLGITTDRLATVSYGEERPADPGHNEAAWSKNRRDEFKLKK